jgi:hypothetical protein
LDSSDIEDVRLHPRFSSLVIRTRAIAGQDPESGAELGRERFDDWETAYEACRERNRSLVAKVGTETAHIWPTGEYELLESHSEPTGDEDTMA